MDYARTLQLRSTLANGIRPVLEFTEDIGLSQTHWKMIDLLQEYANLKETRVDVKIGTGFSNKQICNQRYYAAMFSAGQ